MAEDNVIYISEKDAEEMLRRDVEGQERFIAEMVEEHQIRLSAAHRELALRRRELAEFLEAEED